MTDDNVVVFVTGFSADLIELEGSISDELYADLGKPTLMAFPEIGVTLSVSYGTDGIWRIEHQAGAPWRVQITRCEDREGYTGPDGDVYSDIAEVRGATVWSLR